MPCDPLDPEDVMHRPQGPELGFDFDWDNTNDDLIRAVLSPVIGTNL